MPKPKPHPGIRWLHPSLSTFNPSFQGRRGLDPRVTLRKSTLDSHTHILVAVPPTFAQDPRYFRELCLHVLLFISRSNLCLTRFFFCFFSFPRRRTLEIILRNQYTNSEGDTAPHFWLWRKYIYTIFVLTPMSRETVTYQMEYNSSIHIYVILNCHCKSHITHPHKTSAQMYYFSKSMKYLITFKRKNILPNLRIRS